MAVQLVIRVNSEDLVRRNRRKHQHLPLVILETDIVIRQTTVTNINVPLRIGHQGYNRYRGQPSMPYNSLQPQRHRTAVVGHKQAAVAAGSSPVVAGLAGSTAGHLHTVDPARRTAAGSPAAADHRKPAVGSR